MRYTSNLVRNAMRKLAFVPLAPAAQDAMAQQGGMPPADPAAMGGMPMPPAGDPSMQGGAPMDPAMQGGMPPQGGAPAPIQTVPGPNGEPIDPETGFIVVDPQQGIEQDPMTGILFSKFTGEFATPEGQPLDPQQAQMMIEQAMSQQGGAPMDPAMQGGMPMPPEAEAPAQPTIDDQTGLPIDPETGYYMSPGASMDDAGMGAEAIPGLEQFMAKAEKVNDRQDKAIKRMTSEMVGTRTDIQALRREIQQVNDNQDTALARMENILAMLESIIGNQQTQRVQPLGE